MDIDKVIDELTLEEKAGLLSGADFWNTKSINRLGIQAVMMSDGPHGLRKMDDSNDLAVGDSIEAICFPTASAIAASFDRNVAYSIGNALGRACQHEGVAYILGPAINIKRSPLCGRNFEYFSEDPLVSGEMAIAYIKGVQDNQVGVSVKHFAANNQEDQRMTVSSEISDRALREIYFPAFEKCIKEASPRSIMCSYNQINGVFSSENKWLLTDILRNEWGFKGFVVSDWGAVNDRVEGIKAGLDLEMPSSGGTNDYRIVEAVKDGRLSNEEVNACVHRLLQSHQFLLDNATPETEWNKEQQHELARRLAAECMVLLKNENRFLPLNDTESVAIIGKFAVEPRYQGGGSSHINSFHVSALADELRQYPNITYAQGYTIDSENTDPALLAEAVQTAGKANKVILILGLPDRFESEGYDRKHLRIPSC